MWCSTGVFDWCADRKEISSDCKVKHEDSPYNVFNIHSARQPTNENTPSAGTERIDHIGKCHGLRDAITSSSRTVVFKSFTIHDIPTLQGGPSHSSSTLHTYTLCQAHSMVQYRADFAS